MNIMPKVFTTPDHPIIQIRAPLSKIRDGDLIAKWVMREAFALGTHFHVQTVNHDETKVTAEGHFMVAGVVTKLVTTESPMGNPSTREQAFYDVVQIGKWSVLEAEPKDEAEPKAA